MKYGIAMFPTDYAIQADALARHRGTKVLLVAYGSW